LKKEFMINGSLTVAPAAVGAIQISVPAGGAITLKSPVFSCDKITVTLALVEDASFAAAGTVIVPKSKIRGLSTASRATVKAITGAVVVNGGAVATLEALTVQAVANNVPLSGCWVLQPGKNYLVTITNNNAAAAAVDFTLKLEE